jgi:thioredoxin reductase
MHYDAVIIGGSFAGLSAATYLGRARRSVCVVDAGLPRNRFAAHSHGFLGSDGDNPRAILDRARAQVKAYPTVALRQASASGAARVADGFAVALDSGEMLHATALVLAFGITDELPDIPGVAERWGETVIHCPYCHGYEFSGLRLGVLYMSAGSAHQAMLVSEWGPTTLYLNGATPPADVNLDALRARGIAIEPERVIGLNGANGGLSVIELANGSASAADALYVAPEFHLNSSIPEQLGCALDDAPLGKIIRVDANRLTTVPDVYAAGDVTRGAHTVTWASADGVSAGIAIHRSLVFGTSERPPLPAVARQ